jgi:hypothetical protein
MKAKFTVRREEVKLSLRKQLEDFARQAALVTTGKVIEAFDELLHSTPQRYGSYVASWRIAAGGRVFAHMQDQLTIMPYRDPAAWYMVGSMPAISSAKAANAGVKTKVASFISLSKAIFPQITVYNNTPYADAVESGPLRAENRGYENAFASFQLNLAGLLSEPTSPGDGRWEYYVAREL